MAMIARIFKGLFWGAILSVTAAVLLPFIIIPVVSAAAWVHNEFTWKSTFLASIPSHIHVSNPRYIEKPASVFFESWGSIAMDIDEQTAEKVQKEGLKFLNSNLKAPLSPQKSDNLSSYIKWMATPIKGTKRYGSDGVVCQDSCPDRKLAETANLIIQKPGNYYTEAEYGYTAMAISSDEKLLIIWWFD